MGNCKITVKILPLEATLVSWGSYWEVWLIHYLWVPSRLIHYPKMRVTELEKVA